MGRRSSFASPAFASPSGPGRQEVEDGRLEDPVADRKHVIAAGDRQRLGMR
jgi:hypothetical protein